MGESIRLPTTPLPFRRGDDDVLYVHFINTNEGDCIVLEVPEVLIPQQEGITSNENSKSKYTNILIDMGYGGKSALDSFLDKIGSNLINYAFISHQDIDHCKNFLELLEKNPQLQVWITRCIPIDSNKVIKQLVEGIKFQKQRHFARSGIILSGTRTTIEILGPTEQYLNTFFERKMKDDKYGIDIVAGDLDPKEINDLSLVLKITFCGKVILLPGDLGLEGWANLMPGGPFFDKSSNKWEEPSQKWLENMKKRLDCDLFKFPHHGSPDTTPTYLPEILTPQYGVVTYRNSIGPQRNRNYYIWKEVKFDSKVFEELCGVGGNYGTRLACTFAFKPKMNAKDAIIVPIIYKIYKKPPTGALKFYYFIRPPDQLSAKKTQEK